MKNKLHKLYCKLKLYCSKCLSALEKPLRFLFICSYVFFAFSYFVEDTQTAEAQGDTLEVYISYVLPPVNYTKQLGSSINSPTTPLGTIPNSYLALNLDLEPTTFSTYVYSDIVVNSTQQRSFTNVSYNVYYDTDNSRYYVLPPIADTIKSLYYSEDGYPSVIEYTYIYIYGDISSGLISDYTKTTISGSRLGSTIYQRYYRDDAIVLTVEYKTTTTYVLESKIYYSEPFLIIADVPSADTNGYNLGYYKGYYDGYDEALVGADDVRSPIARIVDGVNSFMRLEIIPNVSISFLLICAFGFLTIRLMLSIK